jgi:prepilin-type N-terminal cleavage/methylation domain-containing protein
MNFARSSRDRGFSLIEVLIAMAITIVVMASVMLLLQKGQRSFRREPEVSDMNASARSGLSRISQDLTVAGYKTPPNMAVMWQDGGGINPDEITIIYADPDVPVSRPKPCGAGGAGGGSGKGGPGGGGGACNTIGMSSTLNIDPASMSPAPADYEKAYQDGQTLYAIQGPNGDPACDAVAPGIIPFELTQPPNCTGAGGAQSGPAGCATLNLNHNPGNGTTGVNLPNGFDNDVDTNCAVIGLFHVVQYRIDPPPPSENPSLERRDLVLGQAWSPVSANIENLQIQYTQGFGDVFQDAPGVVPVGSDPNTWVTGVRVAISGRSASRNLEGASAGVFAAEDTHMRRSFATSVSLRNQLAAASSAGGTRVNGWN